MRILHVADTHLGLRQYGLDERRRDFADAFAQVVSIAVETQVDAVVHAGDLFNDRFPSMEELTGVVRGLSQLRAAGIPFLGVVGNHENKREAQWLDFFSTLELAVHLSSDAAYDLDGVPIWGVDYISRHAEQVKPPQLGGGVLVMHQLLNAQSVSPAGELDLEALWRCGARLVLLGDYHEHGVWKKDGVLVSYPGSTERTSSAERERRGVSIFDYDTLALERRELDTRRFVYVGSLKQPASDPLAEIAARARLVQGAVVVLTIADGVDHTPRQLQEAGAARGALHVIVRRAVEETGNETDTTPIAQLSTLEQLETLIQGEIDRRPFSELTLELERLVRDKSVPDTRVDERASLLLQGAEL